jgi:ankyrin repeat protein
LLDHLPVERIISVVEFLLEKGANIEGNNTVCKLHDAVLSEKYFSHPTACIEQEDSTPLVLASMAGHLRIVELLLERGADIEAWTPVSLLV